MVASDRTTSQAVAVSGLAPTVTESLLMNMLRTYGPIKRIAMNGSGGAHVVFERKGNAFKAASATNGALLNGQPIAVSLVKGFTKTMRPCRGFQAGKCRQGADCKYLHVVDTTVDTTKAQAVVNAKAAAKKPLEIPTIVSATAKKSPTATVTPLASRPCQYFAAGLCTRGSACTFRHDAPVAIAAAPVKAKKKTKAAVAATAALVTATKTPVLSTDTDASRTCIECEAVGAAAWQCAKCDDALYCDACNALVHTSKVMSTHARVALAPLPVAVAIANPPCDECEERESSVACAQCAVVLCATCDSSVHQFKSLRNHERIAISTDAAAVAKPAPKATTTKRVIAAEAPVEPVLKKQKVVAAAAPTTAVASAVPEITYIDSVPRYDLTSESESESDDDDVADEDEQVPAESMDVDRSSSDESDDDPPVLKALRSVAPVVAAAAANGSNDISSESSDDDEDERPVVLAAPVRNAVAASKPIASAATSETSDSDSDDDDEKPRMPTMQSAPVMSRPAAAASSSSDSSDSSDDEDEKPRIAAPKAKTPVAKAPVAKPAPVKRVAARTSSSATPGISTGSSHSLVKKIEAYAESNTAAPLHLDANLNGFERLLAHDCAERLGLAHKSVGEGLERHITISR